MTVESHARLSLATYFDLLQGEVRLQTSALLDEGKGMSSSQASQFAMDYPVVTTSYNDTSNPNGIGTSFSATVFSDAFVKGNLTIAIRGTKEFGDIIPTDADIFTSGAAYDQIVAMANWWKRVSAQPGQSVEQWKLVEEATDGLPADAVLLRYGGEKSYALVSGQTVAASGELWEALQYDSDGKIDVTGHSLGGHLAMAFSTLFSSITGQVIVFNAPGFKSSAVNDAFFKALGGAVPTGSKIINVAADEALSDDSPFQRIAALHSRPGLAVNIPIENQWVSDEADPFGAFNHSITPLVDSLAVYKLLTDLDPSLTTAAYKKILNQATQGTAAGYERIVDALNVLFGIPADALPVGNSRREDLYKALYGLSSDPGYKALNGKLVLRPIDATVLQASALGNDANGLAYRYALLKGDPVAFLGDPSIFSKHNLQEELELYDALARAGSMTTDWIEHRSSYLQRKLDIAGRDEINDIEKPIKTSVSSKTWAVDDAFFDDRTTGYRINQGDQRIHDHHVVFGSDGADAVSGSNKNDVLFGAGGTDYLRGRGGNDHIEGGRGLDVYEYSADGAGDGADTLVDIDGRGVLRYGYKDGDGGRHTTVVADASILLSDTRWESADSRFQYAKEGDTLTVMVTGVEGAQLTINHYGDGDYGIRLWTPRHAPETTYIIAGDLAPQDVDPDIEGVQTGTDDLGNVLTDSTTAEPDRADALYDSEAGDLITSGGANDTVTANRGGDDHILGGDGRDWVDAGAGNDVIAGGVGGTYEGQAGGDVLIGGDGDDALFGDVEVQLAEAIRDGERVGGGGELGEFMSGGAGDDRLVSGNHDDLLSGGNGRDLMIGGAGDDDIWGDRDQRAGVGWTRTRAADPNEGRPTFTSHYTGIVTTSDGSRGDADVIYGGAGADWIAGEAGDDFVDGGSGDDVLYGMDGMDVLVGGTGDDWITGDYAVTQAGQVDSADYLDGGEGKDHLYGGGGDDVLVGGPGADRLAGGDGRDIYVFEKGDGEDRIVDVPSGSNDGSIIVFGEGIVAGDIKFRRGSLLIDVGPQDPGDPASARDALHLEGFDALNPYGTPLVSELRFADGEVMTYADVLARGFDIDGTSGNDNGVSSPRVEGTAVNDRLAGHSGNDILVG